MVNVIYTRKLSVKLYKLCQEISNSCQEITKSSYVMKINWIMCGIVLIILLNLIPELINVIYNCYNWKTGMEWIFMLVEVYRKMIRPLIWDLDLMLWIHFCNILRMNVQSINNLLGEKYLKKAIGKTCKTKCSIIVAEKNSEPEKETLKKCIYVFERTNYAFTLLKRIHKYSIFTFCAKTFIIGLFRFREILLNILSDSKIISHGIDWELILFKNVRNLFIIALLSTTAELYCKELDDTRKIASQIMDYTKEKTQVYDVVKTILWLIEETPPDFVFFGFFKLDGTLPFKYITQYLTYAVILIQFTFL
nr:uncharacterized protein LOC128669628 isoform X2 [Plodia interpunctella]